MNKKIQLSILSIFVAAALIGSVVAMGDNAAYAGDHGKHSKNKKHNDSEQFIEQPQSTSQSSGCASGNDTTASCNNVALSLNLNDGNNALGQQ